MTRRITSIYAFELLCGESTRRGEPFITVYCELQAEGNLFLEAGRVLTKRNGDYLLESEDAAQDVRLPDEQRCAAGPTVLSSRP